MTKFLLFDETFNRRNILADEFINRRKHLTDELLTIFKTNSVCREFRQFLGQLRAKLKILQYILTYFRKRKDSVRVRTF